MIIYAMISGTSTLKHMKGFKTGAGKTYLPHSSIDCNWSDNVLFKINFTSQEMQKLPFAKSTLIL